MVVVDASAVIELLLAGPRSIVEQRLTSDPAWHAPHFVDLEVMHSLRRGERAGLFSTSRAEQALDLLYALPITRWPHVPFLQHAWRLRANLSAYDASYVALAEVLDVPLITRDRRIANAPGHRAKVEVFD